MESQSISERMRAEWDQRARENAYHYVASDLSSDSEEEFDRSGRLSTEDAIANDIDTQEAELRPQLQGTGVSVTRVGDRIVLNMPSNITFATDQDQVIPPFYATLDSVAIVLNKFNKTLVDVDGHTDSTGSAAHNQALSERRAQSVANYLAGRGVDPRRMSAVGYGFTRPIASNDTEIGRAENRRVEIAISPLREG